MTYRNAVRRGPSHGHRQHAWKIWWSSVARFSRYACGQTDRRTHHVTSQHANGAK